MRFHFWYFGEVFILLHLCNMMPSTFGLYHWTLSTWWWAIFFYMIDSGEFYAWKRCEKLLGNIKSEGTN